MGSLHVKTAVSYHIDLIRIHSGALKQLAQGLPNHLILVHSGSVQLASHHHVKVPCYMKMLQNPADKDRGLAGSNRQNHALGTQGAQHPRNPLVNLVLEDSLLLKALSVLLHGALSLLLAHMVELHEALLQRRTDKGLQLVQIRLLNPESRKGVLHAGTNTYLGIRQRPVQIK